ncbi:MAG: APC family permease [Candidatus Bathyarchaeota archaeon]|jgi:amino acid transporter|nr:APC family permease [Candidatus Bathyarchaeota archaeon A05DMB-5]MDH7557787.1 APC family permease [Candidatus Bathyarchaeota archaeon]
MASSKPGLFAREATGLVREIGFTLGVIIILSHVIGLGWQKRAFQFTGPMPMPTDWMPLGLPAIFWAFLICGFIVLITGYAAGYVAAAMPRSGGGYVTISRVIHPSIGYMSGWLMFLAEAFSYGLIGVAVFEGIETFFGIAMAPTAFDFGVAGRFLGGLVIVWIFAVIALLGTKLYGRLMEVIFYIPAAITIIFFAMWIAGAMNPTAIATGVENVMGAPPTTFEAVANATGMTANPVGFFDAFSVALGGAFWAYMGWYATTFLAGEVKEANKKLPQVLLVAGLLIMVVYLLASSLSAIAAMNVEPYTDAEGHQWSFFQAYAWLSYPPSSIKSTVVAARDAAIPNFKGAWSTGLASIIANGMGISWLPMLIAIGAVLWVANDIPPFLLVASRTFFAMSFDRMMPEKFSYVSERWHAPVWAILITAIFAIPACMAEADFPAGAASYLAFAGVVGTDIFDAFFLTMFCISCMLLPLERKEIYDRAAVKHSIGAVVTLGFVATLGGAFCLYIFIKESPWIWSLFTTGAETADIISAIGFFGCIIAGILLYLGFMYRNTTKGVDMRTLYLSIPPE